MTQPARQTYGIDEIKHMLLSQLDSVVAHYAPPANGSHTAFAKYFTLNPGRADRSVGSFYVHMSGPKAGQWCDHAVPNVPGEGYGDIIDLIALSLGCDLKAAVREARAFLGLQVVSPEITRQRKVAIEKSRRHQAEAKAREKADIAKRARQALAIWLSGRESIKGTPVENYLRDQRAVDFARVGRQPRALRYVPECRYYHECEETGEVFEGSYPAMVAIVSNGRGESVAVHRTWLAIGPDGIWDKAPVPEPKKVLGLYSGASINLWRGIGPRGGKPVSLKQCPPDTHVMISEGIEDALSAVMLMPEARVLAAISISNFGQVDLPANVSTVTMIADLDENATSRAQLDHAVAQHQRAGRRVKLFQNKWGGKDLNDALRAARNVKSEDSER